MIDLLKLEPLNSLMKSFAKLETSAIDPADVRIERRRTVWQITCAGMKSCSSA